jgi:hypothetical protein
MKKMIKKFWGVGLIVVLLSSLFVVAAPVSAADPLNWEAKLGAPSTLFYGLYPDSDVNDFAVSGPTMYAATNVAATWKLLQSTTGGAMWADITTRLPAGVMDQVNFVTMAPDDPNVVVVADATPTAGVGVAISVNGGASFTSMGVIMSQL